MKDHIFELRRKIWRHRWSSPRSYKKTLPTAKLKPENIRPERDSSPWPLCYRCSTSTFYQAIKTIEKILLMSPLSLMCQPEPHWLSTHRIFCSCGWHIWITKAMFVNRYLPYCELVTLLVRNIPVDGEQCKWIYEFFQALISQLLMKLWIYATIIYFFISFSAVQIYPSNVILTTNKVSIILKINMFSTMAELNCAYVKEKFC